MHKFGAALLAISVAASSMAYAAPSTNQSPLAPGKPAGVKKAQAEVAGLLGPILVGGAIVGLIVYAAVYQHDNNADTNFTPATGTAP
jgi:hypothetical protein